jgi:hypothetical protein
MGASVTAAYIQTYESTVRYLAQQGISRLRPWVAERSVQSEGHNWERLGKQEAVQKVARLVPTPNQDYPWSTRKSIPVTYHTADSTEQEDIVQMLIDPNSSLAYAQAMAMRRAFDDDIIANATGDSRDGDGNAVPFPAAQQVGDGSTAITFDLVTQVTEKFLNNDIDPSEEKVFVISPAQARKLLQLTEVTSADYNLLRPLQSGEVVKWMGYNWVVSTRLLSPTGDGSDVTCFAMSRKAMGLQVNRDIWARVQEDPSVSFAWRIYCAATFGAVRVEDEHIVSVELSETI